VSVVFGALVDANVQPRHAEAGGAEPQRRERATERGVGDGGPPPERPTRTHPRWGFRFGDVAGILGARAGVYMRRWFGLAGLAVGGAASAEDIELSLQTRLLASNGQPLHGAHVVDASLWTSATSTNVVDRRWTQQFTLNVADGYANLDLGSPGNPVSDAWFDDDVWVELVVDGAPLSPRMKVKDVPARAAASSGTGAGQEFVRYDLAGGTWTTSGATLTSGAYTYQSGPATMRFANWTTYLADLVTFPLLNPGAVVSGRPVTVEMTASYSCVSSDCDTGLRVADGAGRSCSLLPGDQGQLWLYHDGWTTEPNLSAGSSSATRVVTISIAANGGSSTTMTVASSAGFHNATVSCPRGLDPSTGLTAYLDGGHTNESYDYSAVSVRAYDPSPAPVVATTTGARRALISGPNPGAHPDVTIASGVATWSAANAYTQFTGWTTRFDPLATVALAPAGLIPAGTPTRVRITADYLCPSTDCDALFEVMDGLGQWCRVGPGDSDQYWTQSNTQAEASVGFGRASGNEQIVIDFFPNGAGHPTLVSAYSQRPDAVAQPRWVCASSLRPETGLTFRFKGDHVGEIYQVYAIGTETTW
jgi:hypothetical protein